MSSRCIFAAICGSALLAACGSAAAVHHDSAAGTAGVPFVGFAVCMRSHGVPSFSDPGSGGGTGGGVQIIPAGVTTSTPAFKRAFSTCKSLLPGLGAHRQPSAQAIEQLLRFAACMRSHGVTGFPDPRPSPPLTHSGYGFMVRWGGAYLAVPATISTTSPGFRHALSACRFGPVFS